MSLRARLNDLIEHRHFKSFILFVILFNAVILGVETSAPVMDRIGGLVHALDNICLAIFVVELALK
ncbi:MAG: ion transporter, partial [Paracoccaceae bacterium]